MLTLASAFIQVFHELARHLQTRRLLAGETLSLDSSDFYVVVDGTMQVYAQIKGEAVGVLSM
jgi:CRP-like cAMP-binding protein